MPPKSVNNCAPTLSPSLARESVAAFGLAPVGAAAVLVEIEFAILNEGDDGDSFGARHFTNREFDICRIH
jgi:hypothetical protein